MIRAYGFFPIDVDRTDKRSDLDIKRPIVNIVGSLQSIPSAKFAEFRIRIVAAARPDYAGNAPQRDQFSDAARRPRFPQSLGKRGPLLNRYHACFLLRSRKHSMFRPTATIMTKDSFTVSPAVPEPARHLLALVQSRFKLSKDGMLANDSRRRSQSQRTLLHEGSSEARTG